MAFRLNPRNQRPIFMLMKFVRILFLCAVSFLSLPAQTVATTADADYAAFETINKETAPGSSRD